MSILDNHDSFYCFHNDHDYFHENITFHISLILFSFFIPFITHPVYTHLKTSIHHFQ